MLKKRILCVVLLLCLAASFCFFSLAEAIDFSKYSDDEIVELLNSVNSEVAKRGIEKTATFSKGKYIVGEDIPVGSYVLTNIEKDKLGGCIYLYTDSTNGKRVLDETLKGAQSHKTGLGGIFGSTVTYTEPETVYVTLKEGYLLYVGFTFTLTISPGAIFK